MTFRLTKHHGLGNDFLVFLTADPALAGDRAAWIERAPRWCDRHRGIGADGLLIGGYGADDVDLTMMLVNADGSVAEMSGNGIRCLAQAEAMRRGSDTGDLRLATDAGQRGVSYRPDPGGDPATSMAAVDMGAATPGPTPDREIQVDPSEVSPATAAALALTPQRMITLDLGNPHLVLLVDDPEVIDLVAAGSTHEAAFAAGMNVHFIAPTSGETDAITMRVWERGAGITDACGTGATAVARAVHDWGVTGPRVTVHMPGGDVVVDVGDPMLLHGPATFIGHIEVER